MATLVFCGMYIGSVNPIVSWKSSGGPVSIACILGLGVRAVLGSTFTSAEEGGRQLGGVLPVYTERNTVGSHFRGGTLLVDNQGPAIHFFDGQDQKHTCNLSDAIKIYKIKIQIEEKFKFGESSKIKLIISQVKFLIVSPI